MSMSNAVKEALFWGENPALVPYKRSRKARAETAKQRARRQVLIDKLKAGPCTDCGGLFPPICMDFDHLDSSLKTAEVSRLKHMRLEIVLQEIAKCELVCANCHRIRTKDRRTAKRAS